MRMFCSGLIKEQFKTVNACLRGDSRFTLPLWCFVFVASSFTRCIKVGLLHANFMLRYVCWLEMIYQRLVCQDRASICLRTFSSIKPIDLPAARFVLLSATSSRHRRCCQVFGKLRRDTRTREELLVSFLQNLRGTFSSSRGKRP